MNLEQRLAQIRRTMQTDLTFAEKSFKERKAAIRAAAKLKTDLVEVLSARGFNLDEINLWSIGASIYISTKDRRVAHAIADQYDVKLKRGANPSHIYYNTTEPVMGCNIQIYGVPLDATCREIHTQKTFEVTEVVCGVNHEPT